MKKHNFSIYKLCSLFIALGTIFYYKGPCMFFFGEPDFPEQQ